LEPFSINKLIIIIMSNNIFTVEEIIQLFDDFILGNPDPNLNIVTQRIME
jgi:hypothetical protein